MRVTGFVFGIWSQSTKISVDPLAGRSFQDSSTAPPFTAVHPALTPRRTTRQFRHICPMRMTRAPAFGDDYARVFAHSRGVGARRKSRHSKAVRSGALDC